MDEALDFEKLVRDNERLVFRVAACVLGDDAEAEDVAQDVFLRAYRKLGGLRRSGAFRAWVARMSFRFALNRRRALGRARQRDTAWWESSSRAGSPAEELALRQSIARLPEKLRVVLLLSSVDGLECAEVGRTLGIPEGTVRSRLHLARKRLLLELSR